MFLALDRLTSGGCNSLSWIVYPFCFLSHHVIGLFIVCLFLHHGLMEIRIQYLALGFYRCHMMSFQNFQQLVERQFQSMYDVIFSTIPRESCLDRRFQILLMIVNNSLASFLAAYLTWCAFHALFFLCNSQNPQIHAKGDRNDPWLVFRLLQVGPPLLSPDAAYPTSATSSGSCFPPEPF